MNPEEEYANENQDYVNIQEADWREIASAEPEQLVLEEQEPVQEIENKEENQEQEEVPEETTEVKQTEEGEIVTALLDKVDIIDNSPLQNSALQEQIQEKADAENIVLEDSDKRDIVAVVAKEYKQKMQSAALEDLQEGEKVNIDLDNLIDKALEGFTPTDEGIEVQNQEEDLEDILAELQDNEAQIKKLPTEEEKENLIDDILGDIAGEKQLEAEEVREEDTVNQYVSELLEGNEEKEKEYFSSEAIVSVFDSYAQEILPLEEKSTIDEEMSQQKEISDNELLNEYLPKNHLSKFQSDYPNFCTYVLNDFGNYLLGSEKIKKALLKYSVNSLTEEQIAKSTTFKDGSSPLIDIVEFSNPNQSGEYFYKENTIKISQTLVEEYEKIISDKQASSNKKLSISIALNQTLINEFVHFGDALDGKDAIQDENGNVVNDERPGEGAEGGMLSKFDEGNEAVAAIFEYYGSDIDTGLKNLVLHTKGILMNGDLMPVGQDSSKIDLSLIPPIPKTVPNDK